MLGFLLFLRSLRLFVDEGLTACIDLRFRPGDDFTRLLLTIAGDFYLGPDCLDPVAPAADDAAILRSSLLLADESSSSKVTMTFP